MSFENIPADAHWFLFCNDELYFMEEAEAIRLPSTSDLDLPQWGAVETMRIGMLGEKDCYTAHIDPDAFLYGLASKKLRQLHGHLPPTHYEFAFRALHILNWRKNNNYCGACGGPLLISPSELSVQCGACGNLLFPRISPAIIVAIEKGNQLLLARSGRFPQGMFSVIAGFVEPGETFEECVKREVLEEVGINVSNIRYVSSQPWPFPDSLMVGFAAKWKSGDIRIDNDEIVAADWFTVDTMPPLPGKDSIARKLIDRFIAKHRKI